MSLDLENILAKIKNSQWSLADIDWDAPGADTAIPRHQRKLYKRFMADLAWIEQVGSRAFYGMAKNAPNETIREIWTCFAVEEQRHASAEAKLMERWGLIEPGEIPVPNFNIQMLIKFLDEQADNLPVSWIAAAIPMLELGLDGALIHLLFENVDDPVCKEAFEKVNADESRHLAVGFHMLEEFSPRGGGKVMMDLVRYLKPGIRPVSTACLGLGFPAFLYEVQVSLRGMGLDPDALNKALLKYDKLGQRSPAIRRNLVYQTLRRGGHLAVHKSSLPTLSRVAGVTTAIDKVLPRRRRMRLPEWVEMTTAVA